MTATRGSATGASAQFVDSGAVQGYFGSTRNVASGTLGVYDLGSGAVRSGNIASGQVLWSHIGTGEVGGSNPIYAAHHIAAASIASGDVKAGDLSDVHLQSGLFNRWRHIRTVVKPDNNSGWFISGLPDCYMFRMTYHFFSWGGQRDSYIRFNGYSGNTYNWTRADYGADNTNQLGVAVMQSGYHVAGQIIVDNTSGFPKSYQVMKYDHVPGATWGQVGGHWMARSGQITSLELWGSTDAYMYSGSILTIEGLYPG